MKLKEWIKKVFHTEYYLGKSRKPRPLPSTPPKDFPEFEKFIEALKKTPLKNTENI